MNKYIRTTIFLRKTRSINAITFNSFQRKPVKTLNCWDDKVVCHSHVINKPLELAIDYENNNKSTNTGKNQQVRRKSA